MIIDCLKFITSDRKCLFCFFFSADEMINPVEEGTEKSIPSIKKKRKRDKGNTVDVKMQGCN